MASSVDTDLYGFFNGILGIEHTNWANFWKNIIPDGVVSNGALSSETADGELEVYAQSDGMKVHVKTGSAIVAGHRCWVNSEKELTIAANTTGSVRRDGFFVRVTYGNDGESKMTLVVKTGNYTPTRNIGTTVELLLARIDVPDGATTIRSQDVADRRYVFRLMADDYSVDEIATSSSGGDLLGSVYLREDRIHRHTSDQLKSLDVHLPSSPRKNFISEVDFMTASNFTGVTFYRRQADGSDIAVYPRLIGDTLNMPNKLYNVVIWWDQVHFWAAAKAVEQ